MKNGWGGKRRGAGRKRGSKNPNAGRKPGSLNRLTKIVAAECAKTGQFPHEVLLRICRGERIESYEPTAHDRFRAAKAAAPYYAPKLRATAVVPLNPTIDELLAIGRQHLARLESEFRRQRLNQAAKKRSGK